MEEDNRPGSWGGARFAPIVGESLGRDDLERSTAAGRPCVGRRVSAGLLCLVLLTLSCSAPGDAPEKASERLSPEHDVLQGMDENGRIPKVDFPPDLPNPERWRYLPEARIVEGDIFERFLVSTFFVPLFFFEGDVGAGAGVSLTDIDFRNQRRQEFATSTVTYTTEGQANASIVWRRWLDQREAEGGGVFQEERSYLRAAGGFSRTLTRRFFGIGASSGEADESSYTDQVSAVELGIQRSLPEAGGDWVADVGIRLETRNLSRGYVESVPSTHLAFPTEFERDDNLDSLWLGGGLRYDTRDSQHNPYRGCSLGGWVRGTPLMTGGRSGAVYGATGTVVIPMPPLLHDGGDDLEENPPTDRVAFTAQVEDSTGELPFWALPTLGGSYRLRGYIPGRFYDAAAWFTAVEYRLVTIPRGVVVTDHVRVERFGLGLFYELGTVGADLGKALDNTPKYSWGVGGRLGLERVAQFRLDLGFSAEGSNLSITYGLSF